MEQGGGNLNKGGLTRPVGSENNPALPGFNLPVERMEYLPLATTQGDFREIQNRHKERTYRTTWARSLNYYVAREGRAER